MAKSEIKGNVRLSSNLKKRGRYRSEIESSQERGVVNVFAHIFYLWKGGGKKTTIGSEWRRRPSRYHFEWRYGGLGRGSSSSLRVTVQLRLVSQPRLEPPIENV